MMHVHGGSFTFSALNTVHPKLGVCTHPCCLNKFIPHTGSHWSWSVKEWAFQPWSGNLLVYRDPNTWQSQLTISQFGLLELVGGLKACDLVVHTLIHSCWLWPLTLTHCPSAAPHWVGCQVFPIWSDAFEINTALITVFPSFSLFSFSYPHVHSFFLGYIGVYLSSSLWFSLPSPAKVSHCVTAKSLNYNFFFPGILISSLSLFVVSLFLYRPEMTSLGRWMCLLPIYR